MINKKQMWSDSPFNQWTEEELLCMKYQGICYGKGGGSAPPPPPATQTVRQSSEFPEELKPFVSDIFGKAQAIQEQRQEEGFRPELTQQLASFTPDQQAAFTGIREQVGQTRPLFEEATQLTRGATRAATDPAEVQALMNPFLRNVTDIEKREAQRIADVQEQQLAAQAAQAGAFGGSRAAILEAERQRNLAQQLGDIEARGRLAAFQDAQARLQNQFGREAAGAAQLSALGAAIPAQTFKELGALSGVGAAEQQQTQRALDIATQQAREEYGFPMQTLQDFQSILRGFPLPATTNVSRQTFSPAQPLSTQLLGLGTGLAGLAGAAGAFKKAGGLVGAPVAMKNGGYVKLAGGGGLGQLMQGKLPSNRVRMGKTAYQNVGYADSTIPPYGKLFGESLRDLTPEIIRLREAGVTQDKLKKLADEIKLFKSRLEDSPNRQQSKRMIDNFTDQMKSKYGDAAVQATFTMARLPFTTDAPKSDVAGNVATQSVQAAASSADVPKVPAPAPPLSPRMEDFLRTTERREDVRDMDQYKAERGYLTASAKGLQTIPAVSGQVPTEREALDVGIVGPGAIPQRFITPAEGDFPASLAAPSLVSAPPPVSVVDSRVPSATVSLIPAAAPAAPALVSAPSVGGSASSATVPVNMAGMDPTAADAIPKRSLKDFLAAPKLSFTVDPMKPPPPGSDLMIQQSEADKMFSPDVLTKMYGEGAEDFLTERFTGTGSPLLSAASDPTQLQIDKAREEVQEKQPEGPFLDEETTVEAEQKRADAEAAKAPAGTAADPLTGPFLDEEVDKGRPSPGESPAQVDYNAKIAEINNKDYAADIKEMLGDAPTYEKGEEPDFAARKWLALANFGAGILASGGGKTLAQSIGEAAKPALKELADIGKEERKIKKELRQERNAQKRADYQDKLQRFNLQRQLKSDDIDLYEKTARLSLAADTNRMTAARLNMELQNSFVDRNYKRIKMEVDNYTLQKDKEGFMSLNDAQKQWGKLEASALKNAQDTITAMQSIRPGYKPSSAEVSAIVNGNLNSLRPSFIQRLENSVKVGDKILTQEQLTQQFGPLAPTTPDGGGGKREIGNVKGAKVLIGR